MNHDFLHQAHYLSKLACFRLLLGKPLGEGAFGLVMRAEASGLNKAQTTTVAVKMLKGKIYTVEL